MPIALFPPVRRPDRPAVRPPAAGRAGKTPVGFVVLLLLFFIMPITAPAADGEAVPRKTVLLIAGPDDDHPPGTHEYAATVRTLADLLETSNVGPRVELVVAENGWPADDAVIERADCIFLASAGADHDEADHPFLKGDRWERVEAATARGCGLVMLHWSTFLPDRLDESVLRTLGGRFDYEGGPPPKGWESRIDFAEVAVTPASPAHPALAGVERFTLHDEFYHHLRFPADRAGWTPLLTAPLPGEDGNDSAQTVAWALERATKPGGPSHRAVGFTGGHYQENFEDEDYHRFLLNAVAWSAGVAIPEGGVRTFDELWTPASVRVGTAEPYELEKEKDWHDDRITRMDQGPFAFSSIELPGGEVVRKAVVLRKPDGRTTGPGTFAVVDTETALIRCSYDADRMLDHSDRRFGLIDLPSVPADAADIELIPHALTGWTTEDGDPAAVRYTGLTADGPAGVLHFEIGGVPVRFDVRQTPSLRADMAADSLVQPYPLLERDDPFVPPTDPAPRWGEPPVTSGSLGDPLPQSGGAFAVDTVELPFENPHRALLYLSGIDFTPGSGEDGGTAYVAAAHGDVWQVRGLGGDLSRVEWRRFATGLYQPLGLKVRDGEVFVLGRDRITKLVDVNGDGEADRYENFNSDLDILGQPHAYAMALETDAAGNFYFLKSGPAETEHGGTLVRVSADGSEMTVLGTGFRHPNGIGVAPPGTDLEGFVTAADNEGNWVPATPLHAVPAGTGTPRAADANYYAGYVPTAHRRERGRVRSAAALDAAGRGDQRRRAGLGAPRRPRGGVGAAGGGDVAPVVRPLHGEPRADRTGERPRPSVPGGGHAAAGGAVLRRGLPRGVVPGDGRPVGRRAGRVADRGGPRRLPATPPPHRPAPAYAHRRAGSSTTGSNCDFATELGETADDPAAWQVEAWTYRRGADYGSPELKASDPTVEGHDAWAVETVAVSPDRTRVFLELPGIAPVMQYSIAASLNAADGEPVPVDLFGTIHRLDGSWAGWED